MSVPLSRLVHVARRQWARGAAVAGAQVAVVAATVLALQQASGGAYLAGLQGAAKVAAGIEYVRSALWAEGDPVVMLLLLAPVAALIRPPGGPDTNRGSVRAVVACFWLVTLLGAVFASARAGSGPYYFLEAASYGGLLLLLWAGGPVAGSRPSPVRVHGVMVVLMLACLPTGARWVFEGHPVDVAYFRSVLLSGARERLAAAINQRAHYCYSDDPGLNALLDRPAVIYPVLQLQMIEAGALPERSLYEPLERALYDCVVFSGINRIYRGRPVVPRDVTELAERMYPASEAFGRYRVLHRPAQEPAS